MSDSQRYPCLSWNDASYHSRIIKITDFIINLVLMDLLNPMQKLVIHLILQHQQAPWLHQQGGHQTILKLQGAVLSLLLVEVNDSVGPQAYGGDGGVEHGAIQVRHDPLAWMILIKQYMVCQGGFDAINNFLDPKHPQVIHPFHIGL